MTNQMLFHKNVILGTEFDKYVLEHPEFAEQIPDNAQVVLLPKDDPELYQANLRLGERYREGGQPTVFVVIERLAPAPTSRLVNPKVCADPDTVGVSG